MDLHSDHSSSSGDQITGSDGKRRARRTQAPQLVDLASSAPEVPGFRLERMIGEGGFGQVWRAVREADLQRVAIKVLHLELVRSIDALTRFGRELEAIERLHHPNVVGAMGHGALVDGRPYLVLEYIEGPSLREVIHDRGGVPPEETLAILEPVARALGVAHAAGLVHRDVKASNVILGRHADGALRPVLLDFGLVKLLDQAGPGLTSSRSMLGTPSAMAPEQMRGLPVDARTDVYALGLLAYHILTGQPAFGGAPGVVQSYMQIHGARPRASSKVDIDPAIDAPIARALAVEPAARFATPLELWEALSAVIRPATGTEVDVVALYVEGSAAELARANELATAAGLEIAMIAPDCLLAVGPVACVDVAALRTGLQALPGSARIALGWSRATLGVVIDGPALDVEGWAPYPLTGGMWVAEGM